MVKYFIRLDDFCPTNNLAKWERFFRLFDDYGIKPFIAVIPNNKDPKLKVCGPENKNFWQTVRSLQNKGYILAMHGYEHKYVNKCSGILKYNNRSEFAGLPLAEQETKIQEAHKIFVEQKIKARAFIAPAHSFDYNTLLALKKHTSIDIISDGFLHFPYKRRDFKWMPVQLSEAVYKKKHIWTFNYHPETCTDEKFQKLVRFIQKHHKLFGDFHSISYRPYNFNHYIFEKFLIYQRYITVKGKTYLKKWILNSKVKV